MAVIGKSSFTFFWMLINPVMVVTMTFFTVGLVYKVRKTPTIKLNDVNEEKRRKRQVCILKRIANLKCSDVRNPIPNNNRTLIPSHIRVAQRSSSHLQMHHT